MLGTVPGGLISSDLTYVASHATFYSLSYGSQLAAGYLFFPAVFSAYLALKRTNWTLSGTMSYTLGKNNHRRNFFRTIANFFAHRASAGLQTMVFEIQCGILVRVLKFLRFLGGFHWYHFTYPN